MSHVASVLILYSGLNGKDISHLLSGAFFSISNWISKFYSMHLFSCCSLTTCSENVVTRSLQISWVPKCPEWICPQIPLQLRQQRMQQRTSPLHCGKRYRMLQNSLEWEQTSATSAEKRISRKLIVLQAYTDWLSNTPSKKFTVIVTSSWHQSVINTIFVIAEVSLPSKPPVAPDTGLFPSSLIAQYISDMTESAKKLLIPKPSFSSSHPPPQRHRKCS